MKIYMDMDGVLTDFDKQLADLLDRPLDRDWDFGNDPKIWAKIDEVGEDYWATMEWIPDGHKLWDAVKKHDPTILSSPSNHVSSIEGKKIWLKNNLPGVPYIIEKKKEQHANKEAILIDDRKKNIDKWEQAGGIGILHKNAENTIEELGDIMSEKEKNATQSVVEDPAGRDVVIMKQRKRDVFTPQQMRRNVIPPKKGIGAPYKRQELGRVPIDAQRVVLAYLRSTEKTSFLDSIKSLVSEVPAAARIRNKDDALKIIWDFVKKIGTERVLEVLESVERVMSSRPPSAGGQRVAATDSALGQLVRTSMYPMLFLAAVLLYMFVGKPQIEQFKQQLQHAQQQQMSVINEIGQ